MRSSSVSSSLAALAVLCLAACAGAPPAARPAPETVEGILSVDGDRPFERRIVLDAHGGGRRALVATDLEAELLRLDGLGVRVVGRAVTAAGAHAFAVEDYELLPIEGIPPSVGVVVVEGDRVLVQSAAAGEELLLAGALAGALRAHAGMKVWVWGTFAEPDAGRRALSVRAYGVLGPGPGVTRP